MKIKKETQMVNNGKLFKVEQIEQDVYIFKYGVLNHIIKIKCTFVEGMIQSNLFLKKSKFQNFFG